MTKTYLSFDCESCGLFGEVFAVGYVVVNQQGQELHDGYLACPVDEEAPEADLVWVRQNVIPVLPEVQTSCPTYANCESLPELLQRFWYMWQEYRHLYPGIMMVVDCGFPVETGFLHRVANEMQLTIQDSPYPVLDVASVLAGAGYDPLAELPREPTELPQHNPVNDARQSARILVQLRKELAGHRALAWAHGWGRDPDEPIPEGTLTWSGMELEDGDAPAETITVSTGWTPPQDPEDTDE